MADVTAQLSFSFLPQRFSKTELHLAFSVTDNSFLLFPLLYDFNVLILMNENDLTEEETAIIRLLCHKQDILHRKQLQTETAEEINQMCMMSFTHWKISVISSSHKTTPQHTHIHSQNQW